MKEIAKTESLVDAYKINKALKLNTVNKGELTDNVLVHGVDNEVKSIPRSEFGIVPTLQEVFAKTPNSTYGSYSANDGGSKTQFVIGVDDGGIQEARIDGAVAVSSKSGSLGVYNGEVNFSQYSNGGQSSLSFAAPIATGGTANFKIPAKLTGDYTLATTEDTTLQKLYSATGGKITSADGHSHVELLGYKGSTYIHTSNSDYSNFSSIAVANSGDLVITSKGDTYSGGLALEEGALFFSKMIVSSGKELRIDFNDPVAPNITYLNFPAPAAGGRHTLATTSDFKTINGNNIVGTGDIVIQGNATSGTYTPVMTNAVNIKNIWIEDAHWTKIGNVVTVTCPLQFSFTEASISSTLRISLPFIITSSTINLGIGNLNSVFSIPVTGIVQKGSDDTALFIVTSSTDPNTHVGAMTVTYTTAS